MLTSPNALLMILAIFAVPLVFWNELEAYRVQMNVDPRKFYYGISAIIGIMISFTIFQIMDGIIARLRRKASSEEVPDLHSYMKRLRSIVAGSPLETYAQKVTDSMIRLQKNIDDANYEEAIATLQAFEEIVWHSDLEDKEDLIDAMQDIRGEIYVVIDDNDEEERRREDAWLAERVRSQDFRQSELPKEKALPPVPPSSKAA